MALIPWSADKAAAAGREPVTRAVLEHRIRQARAKQERLPAHWSQRREEIAAELEVLVLEWLAAEA